MPPVRKGLLGDFFPLKVPGLKTMQPFVFLFVHTDLGSPQPLNLKRTNIEGNQLLSLVIVL